MEKVKIVANADNAYLGASGGKGIFIGCVDEVNGVGATEVPDFVPTRHELVQLAMHWERVRLENMFFMYWSNQPGSTELRLEAFSRRRLHRIAEAIGVDVVESAVNEASEQFGKECDPRMWDRYRNNLPLPDKVAGKLANGERVIDADWEENDLPSTPSQS